MGETVKRDGQWLCGMTLEAITRRCGIRIVVVEERADGSAVPYVFGPNKKREFPVVLYLKDQHFQLVRKRDGHVFPVEWEKSSNTNDASRLHLKGAGKWWADSTPSEKGSEKKKVNRSSTPAASLSSAAGSQLRFWSRGSPSEAPVSTHGSPRVRYWKKTTPDQSFVSGRASLADKLAQEHEDSGSARSVTALPPRPSEVGGQVSDALFGPGPTPEGRIGTIHELTKEEQMSRPWWTCQLCGFHVFQKWIQGKYCNAHYTHRKRHLLKAHGVKKPPPLPKGSMSMPCELPRGSSSIMMCFGKLFGKPITGSDGPAVTESPLKGPELFPKEVLGFGTIDALIVIMSCLEETSLKLVPAPSQATPASFGPSRKDPAVAEVAAAQKSGCEAAEKTEVQGSHDQWQGKRGPREQVPLGAEKTKTCVISGAQGTAQTKRGYRGQRIGEARHPGPSGLVAALFCIMAQDRVSGRRYEVQFLASGRLSELLRGLSGMGMWNVEPAPGQRHVTVFSCLECANQIFGKRIVDFS